jgi:hypothetical protein
MAGNQGSIFFITKIQGVSAKKSFVLRVDNDTYKCLEKWASDEFRSVNGQIEFLLDKALKDSGRRKSSGKEGESNTKAKGK